MPKIRKIIRISALLYLIAVAFFVWGVAAGRMKIFPWKQMNAVYEEAYSYFTFNDGPEKTGRDRVLLDRQERRTRHDFSGFELRDQEFKDTGYLLISRYSKEHSQVVVDLFSIAKEQVLHTWEPPLAEIFEASSGFGRSENSVKGYRAQHPLLLKDGGLVFTSGEGPLARISRCGSLVWVVNRHFHHAIEVDHRGNMVVPIVIEGEKTKTAARIRDDGFAIVSFDGHLINEYSVTDILIKNGYRGLIYGVGKFEEDRIHLNDAQPILQSLKGANTGDVALSSRHLSTVFLFDPKTGGIKWLKTGPWLNQHDINQLGDGTYSIFGNDVTRRKGKQPLFVEEKKVSDIYLFNPADNVITRPYSKVMAEHQIATHSAGRSKILANGDVFIEESDRSRILRISKDRIRWEYVNSITSDTVGAIHWSRYITDSEIDLTFLENLACN